MLSEGLTSTLFQAYWGFKAAGRTTDNDRMVEMQSSIVNLAEILGLEQSWPFAQCFLLYSIVFCTVGLNEGTRDRCDSIKDEMVCRCAGMRGDQVTGKSQNKPRQLIHCVCRSPQRIHRLGGRKAPRHLLCPSLVDTRPFSAVTESGSGKGSLTVHFQRGVTNGRCSNASGPGWM